ncbi:MAG: hypothetical protein IJE08_14240 [Clostridia bacterium]|nr:hypothetical protein [Clostridia bacterium]
MNMFIKAKPVFLEGLDREMNITGVFICELPKAEGTARLRVAAATFYKAYFGGKVISAGPARAAHGHARTDEIMINLTEGGTLRIDVASYYVAAHSCVKHPGFLAAEVVLNDEVIAATGYDFAGFRSLSRVQKVMRFSLQRHFSEVYRGMDELEAWPVAPVEEDMKFIPRGAPVPCMDEIDAKIIAGRGTCVSDQERLRDPWYIRRIPEHTEGFGSSELEAAPYRAYRCLSFRPDGAAASAFEERELEAGEYVMCDFGRVNTGFVQADVEVFEESELFISYEDYCPAPYVATERLFPQCVHVLNFTLKPGVYHLEGFDPMEMRYAQATVLRGRMKLRRMGMRLYIYPELKYGTLGSDDVLLNEIYDAAASTFRQNSLDIYMDCPGRERAGWLCDSYYTAQAEYTFTGDNKLERTFLRNFVDAGRLPALPEGMLPMTYPSEPTGSFIPQWAMWYVLELQEALERSPEMDKEEYRAVCDGLLGFFGKYLNEDGLLESMPGWNFVEWSKCNDWTGGVNYPTNFLYSRMLRAIGGMYDRPELIAQADAVRDMAARLSFDGELFTENALRDDEGRLVNTGNTSETCQYYAIHFGGIDLDAPEYAYLKRAFEEIFGPDHEKYALLGREVEPSNAFIGIYVRLECLLERGMYQKVLEEIKGFFGGMAELTGTLWEHKSVEDGSLNHGFASYAATAIRRALGK